MNQGSDKTYTPDISVIVLTYNQEATVGRTLESILSQTTNASYEIIIGDDFSSDATQRICKEYESTYPHLIRYIRNPRNLGLVKNYYNCLALSRGKYITDCAGDDFWNNRFKLQKSYEILESRPDVTLIAGMWQCRNSVTESISIASNAAPPGEYKGREALLNVLLHKTVVNLSCSLYRKSIVEVMIKKNPEIMKGENLMYEDLQIILTCLSQGTILILPDVFLSYTMGQESVSNPSTFSKRFNYTFNALKQFRLLQEFFLPSPISQEEKLLKEFYRKKGNYLMAMAFNSGIDEIDKKSVKECKRYNYSLKGNIYSILMSNNIIWNFALKLRRIISGNKMQ